MPKRILEGQVVSDKMDKTITVLVERRFMHPVYKKYVKRTDKYAAHDESNAVKVGERVQIQECRPLSKRKTWCVLKDGVADLGAAARDAEPVKKAPAPKKAPAKKAEKKVEAKAETKKPAAKKAPAKKPAAKKTTTSKKKDD